MPDYLPGQSLARHQEEKHWQPADSRVRAQAVAADPRFTTGTPGSPIAAALTTAPGHTPVMSTDSVQMT
jgi:hypothetical protein